ncbi:Uma2 family endonuclease [Nocardia lijiangensis]|uniref:Uma2 family endonuclease n=1 Tax=Nocardia lijiangensis TaxID=299618 RepID=UPI00082D3BC9|nr:Uma2 family endonuclease [Nocardia lijiangensis]
MTISPLPRLLTMADWAELPEDTSSHIELQEGVLIVSPRPKRQHVRAGYRLARQLEPQLPAGLESLIEFEVCVDAGAEPTVRGPDLVLTQTDGPEDRLAASDALLVVEIISPGSRRTDTVTKPFEYAAAGIPHYWVIDPVAPISLTAYRLAGEFGYLESPAVTGEFVTTVPFPLRIDLDALV